jgi:hypothetical protein
MARSSDRSLRCGAFAGNSERRTGVRFQVRHVTKRSAVVVGVGVEIGLVPETQEEPARLSTSFQLPATSRLSASRSMTSTPP